MKLADSFYTREDVVQVAKDLLGKVLVTEIDGFRTAGMITETEAYAGISDKASHAWNNRRTRRTEVMYGPGGTAYVYLCYGIHHLFNVVTNTEGTPHAVLIRGIEPLEGIEQMMLRRKKQVVRPALTAGPGVLSAAMGILTLHTGLSLQGPLLYIEDRGIPISGRDIIATPRIGVDYAGTDAARPYRFYIRGNRFISPEKN